MGDGCRRNVLIIAVYCSRGTGYISNVPRPLACCIGKLFGTILEVGHCVHEEVCTNTLWNEQDSHAVI